MRVLIAWELGDNLGHVMRQLPVMQALCSRGHDVVFAGRDAVALEEILRGTGIRRVPVPACRRRLPLDRDIANFGDVLAFHGFAELQTLSSLVQGWRKIFRHIDPDVVVIEHAPAALFAARLSGLCCCQLGTGFAIPPPLSPYPCFRPWLAVSNDDLLASEANIVCNLNVMCRASGKASFERLTDLMTSDVDLLATLPELDHYPQRVGGRYVGPLIAVEQGVRIDWPARQSKKIFIYLQPDATLARVLNALRQFDCDVLCTAPGASAAFIKRYESQQVRISRTHVMLDPLLADCDLAITHSGHGTVAGCLLAGVPMLVIPRHVEQMMMADCVTRAGMGLAALPDIGAADLVALLRRLLTESVYSKFAERLAEKYKNYEQARVVERIANTIERLPEHVAMQRSTHASSGGVE